MGDSDASFVKAYTESQSSAVASKNKRGLMRQRVAAYSIEEQQQQFEVDTRITSKDIHKAGQDRTGQRR